MKNILKGMFGFTSAYTETQKTTGFNPPSHVDVLKMIHN